MFSALGLGGWPGLAHAVGVPTPLALEDVTPAGDLHRRSLLNFRRLHDEPFRFDAMIHASTAREAPGDWIGRALLGLSVLGQTLKQEPRYLEECLARLPEAVNDRGYIGVIHPAGTVDENQLGGHNGLLRGLCEYYLWKRDPRALARIRAVVRQLMVPARPLVAHYPDRPLAKLSDGSQIGLTVANDGPWVGLSTDIGTVFLLFDGLTQAFLIDPDPALRALIETMIARYAQLDIVALGGQTHSCLSALRGILRWHNEVDARPEYLELVRSRYRHYRELAETEHHANYNWFGRPDWTEACAVIDAFLLAVQLWRTTGDVDYLREAHLVYHNALCYAQRPNGGFGCDHCVGARGEVFLSPHEFFEAPWCCSMRGAEGLARAAQFNVCCDADRGRIWLAFHFGGQYVVRLASGVIELNLRSDYPHAGRVRIAVVSSTVREPVELHCFVPPGVAADGMALTQAGKAVPLTVHDGFAVATVGLRAGDLLELEFSLTIEPRSLQTPGRLPAHHRFAHGPLVLGAETAAPVTLTTADEFQALGSSRYRCRRTGTMLAPLTELTYLAESQARAHRAQLLFADPSS